MLHFSELEKMCSSLFILFDIGCSKTRILPPNWQFCTSYGICECVIMASLT